MLIFFMQIFCWTVFTFRLTSTPLTFLFCLIQFFSHSQVSVSAPDLTWQQYNSKRKKSARKMLFFSFVFCLWLVVVYIVPSNIANTFIIIKKLCNCSLMKLNSEFFHSESDEVIFLLSVIISKSIVIFISRSLRELSKSV